MSIKSVIDLKTEFATGNRATSDSFGDLIDSSYNKNDDSLLKGPLGLTGKYGLQGPTGGTYFGGFVSLGSTPGSSAATGSTGQMVFETSGATGYLYIHNGTRWFKFTGLSEF